MSKTIPSEFCFRGKDLFKAVMDGLKYSEFDLACYFRQLFKSLTSLHNLNIVHRNISGKNLVFAKNDNQTLLLKGLRYMLSTNEYSKFSVTVQHSLQYLSPEIISQQTNLVNIAKSDIWACGVILYTLLFGNNLFPIEFPFEKYTENIVKCDINWSLKSPLLDNSRLAVDFCKSLLKLNPDERLTAKEALFHPWLSGEKFHTHHKQFAPDRFYAEVRNAIDELDTLEENTTIQCKFEDSIQTLDKHKLNDELPVKQSVPNVKVNTGMSTSFKGPRMLNSRDQKSETKCLPIKFRRPSFRFIKFGSKRQDKKPLMENPVVDKYIKDDRAH